VNNAILYPGKILSLEILAIPEIKGEGKVRVFPKRDRSGWKCKEIKPNAARL
jgi:hypothetical protein